MPTANSLSRMSRGVIGIPFVPIAKPAFNGKNNAAEAILVHQIAARERRAVGAGVALAPTPQGLLPGVAGYDCVSLRGQGEWPWASGAGWDLTRHRAVGCL